MVDDLSGGALHPRGTTRGAAVIILMPVLERRCAHFPEGANFRNLELDEIERKRWGGVRREEGATCRPGWAPG
jgi:hypothetical protein